MSRPWRRSLVASIAFGLAAAVHLGFRVALPPGALPRPLVASLPWLLAALGAVAAITSALAWTRSVTGTRRRVVVVLVHLLGSVALAIAVLLADPSFPFGPTLVDDLALPDDRGHAYLYRGGVLCSQALRIAAPGQWYSVALAGHGAYSCDREGTVVWNAARAQPEAVDATGAPLPSDGWARALGEGLDWRPH